MAGILSKTTKQALTAQQLVEEYDGEKLICPMSDLMDVLGKPHTMKIIYVLNLATPWRFTQIQKILRMQPKTLAGRLQELIKFGLVTRKSYNEIPPRVDYELTKRGRDVTRIYDVFNSWAERSEYTELKKRSS